MTQNQAEKEIFERINKNPLMWKFKFYGFFKNLKFFEPFLLIIFLAWNVSLFQIGILIAIQEAVIFIFEVPSGMLADNRGKKNEMLICFAFYISSFIFYFMGSAFYMLIFGAIFFGLGEAFRSGTHKAMEMQWMEREGLMEYKSYVYGRTRSYSLYGSALAALLAIILILNIPAARWIFLITIIPYIIDFILISTYPDYMNEKAEKDGETSYIRVLIDSFKNLKIVLTDKKLRKGLFSSSSYDAVFRSIKDYIQPIMQILIVVLFVRYTLNKEEKDFYLALVLGLIYAIFYLTSSFSSRNAYRFQKKCKSSKVAMDLLFYFFSILLFFIAVFIWFELPIIIIILYLFVYVLYNIRRPIMVDYLGDCIDKDQRATILSIEAQLRSLLVIFFAPLIGYIAEYYSIGALFFFLAIFLIVINIFFLSGDGNQKSVQNC